MPIRLAGLIISARPATTCSVYESRVGDYFARPHASVARSCTSRPLFYSMGRAFLWDAGRQYSIANEQGSLYDDPGAFQDTRSRPAALEVPEG